MGVFGSFPLAKKLTSGHKLLNVFTETLLGILGLICNNNPLQTGNICSLSKGQSLFSVKMASETPDLVITITDDDGQQM